MPLLRSGDVTVGLTKDGLALNLQSGPLSAGLSSGWNGEVIIGAEATWRF